jgi:putative esterase
MKLRPVVAPVLCLAIMTALLPTGTASAGASHDPFAEWNVTVTPDPTGQGATSVDFTSPALGRRTHNTVYLPADYQAHGAPSPVLCLLHGAVVPALDNPVGRPLAGLTGKLHTLALTGELGPDGGARQAYLQNFGEQRTRAHFMVVVPDTGQPAACQTCLWNNGRDDPLPNVSPATARIVPAETFVDTEFIPLVQHLFNTRTDAGGRGIAGFSTGGVGAWLQAMRHPDMFTFVAPISGPYDLIDDLPIRLLFESLGIMRDQGYGTSATEPLQWRRFNPADLVGNLRGAGSTIVASSGDGCVTPGALTDANCRRYSPVLNPDAASLETLARNDMNQYAEPGARAAGVQATFIELPGVHGANNAEVYADDILPAANTAFSTARRTSSTFDYTSADHDFSVWDYTIRTGRTADEQFVTLTHARRDGRRFAITGTGRVTLDTPATFTPGKHYAVSYRGVPPQNITADQDGRLHILVDLPATAATRDVTVNDL